MLLASCAKSSNHSLEESRDMRWRMLRGEILEMQCMMLSGRKHARELTTRIESLDYALEAAAVKEGKGGA